jgi:hypothetical protein
MNADLIPCGVSHLLIANSRVVPVLAESKWSASRHTGAHRFL